MKLCIAIAIAVLLLPNFYQEIHSDTVLEIKIIDSSCALIKNVGKSNAINVSWEMWVDCSILFIAPPKQNGSIALLKPNEEKLICYEKSSFIFGFGLLKLKAMAKADNAKIVEDEKIIGILIGSFAIIFKV